MKVIFEQKDIEAMLLEKAQAMGVKANRIAFDTFGTTATLYYIEPLPKITENQEAA